MVSIAFYSVAGIATVILLVTKGYIGCTANLETGHLSHDHVEQWFTWQHYFLILAGLGLVFDLINPKSRNLEYTGVANPRRGSAGFARAPTSGDMQTLRLTTDGPDKKSIGLQFV